MQSDPTESAAGQWIRFWRRQRSSRSVLELGAVLLLLIAGFIAYSGWVARTQALAGAKRQLSNLAVVLEDQTSRAMHGADLILRDSVERMQRLGDPAHARGSAALHNLLRERVSLVPQIEGLRILDRTGRVMLDTRRFPAQMDAWDADPSFIALSRHGQPLTVGAPACDGGGRCVFMLGRRVQGLRGEFIGVVQAAIRVDYFRDLYRAIDLGSAGAVVLRTRDGVDLAGYSSGAVAGDTLDDGQMTRHWLRALARLPGNAPRLSTLRTLPDYPLAVDASMSRAAVLSAWLQQTERSVIGALTVSTLLWLLLVALARQFAQRERDERAMRRLVEVDTLTGVASRNQFERRLAKAIEHAVELRDRAAGGRGRDRTPRSGAGRRREPAAEGRVGLLLIDLDRFKTINDTLGHRVGDELLRQFASRLRACVPEHALVARLGGDEFVVMVEDSPADRAAAAAQRRSQGGVRRVADEIDRPDEAVAIAGDILAAVSRPFVLDRGEYHVTGSVGIASFPDDAETAESLLANADIAMYRAKEQGKNTYQTYSAHMSVQVGERLALESALRGALARGEFLLHYQPKLDLRTDEVRGVEALVRWRHPERGMVPPATFIALAEETGVIVPLGRWILETACRQALVWQDAGLPPVQVAVNLSARQFGQIGLVTQVREVLQEIGLRPSLLELEITESMVMRDPDQAVRVLGQLKRMGISLSIDDFGTGYSSLSYLKRFPIDGLKIDRSFIQDVPGDADDVAITHTIIAMAHALKLEVVAEGVENAAQLAFLREAGCDLIQGYLLSPPLAGEETTDFLMRASSERLRPCLTQTSAMTSSAGR